MENFIIIDKIGEGAYSTVYTVRRIEDGNLYALKKIKIQSLSQKEKQNALNEVRILASVNSPFVISYKESFIEEKEQTLCIVMEYADEGDLFQKITLYKKLHTTFEENDVWKIFIQITKGLHDLHEYSILHRDLKSANVFLFRDGTAKLGDLNVSKISFRGLGCTQTGTPYYASPEVWRDNPYNLKSDIWSLGCLCYELLMLKTPFRAESMEALYRKVMRGKYPEINKKYSNKFDNVISYMLQLKPENRPNTQQILNMPEIQEKIKELNIFPLYNDNELNLNSEYDINNRISSGKSRSFNVNKSFQSSEQNSVSQVLNKNSRRMKKSISGNSIEQSIFETDNNASNSKILKGSKTPNKANKSEIISIMNNNLNYFNKKKKEENKFVINTIRIPKEIINLNKRLPASQYESDIINKKKIFYGLSFQSNQVLPLLRVKYNSIEPEKTKINLKKSRFKRNKDNENDITNSKSVDVIVQKSENKENKEKEEIKNIIKRTNRFEKFNRYNTLKMMVDKNRPFNFKGKIDIIVEEDDEEKAPIKVKHRSINSWKDVRKLYAPYYPKILKENNGFKYNLNEENIFGNLYYSMNQDFLKGKMANILLNDKYLNLRGEQRKPLKLVPIMKYKSKKA